MCQHILVSSVYDPKFTSYLVRECQKPQLYILSCIREDGEYDANFEVLLVYTMARDRSQGIIGNRFDPVLKNTLSQVLKKGRESATHQF